MPSMVDTVADAPPAKPAPQQEQTPLPSPKKHPWGHKGEDRYPVKNPSTYTDHEKRYPPDKFGHEADDDARVWRLYKAGAMDKEEDRVDKLRRTIDSLPVFAGLFSAVQTAFIIEGAKRLQPDFTEYQARAFFAVHRANSSGLSGLSGSFDPDTFIAPAGARWANGLWLGGLILSLFVALHAIMAQQWLEDYSFRINEPAASHRRWVWRHLVFSAGFERWKIDAFISALPLALHLSLLMFVIGLVLFLVPIDVAAAFFIVCAAGAGFIFYLVVTFIPVFSRDCPTATPLLRLSLYIYQSFTRRFGSGRQKTPDAEKGGQDEPGDLPISRSDYLSDEEVLVRQHSPFGLDIEGLRWMIKYLPAVDDVNAALDAVGGLSPHEGDLSATSLGRPERFAEINHALDGRVDALSSGIATTEPVAIARILRTSVALAAVNRQLGLQPPLKKYPSQLLRWMKEVSQYDVFWLCQILTRLDAVSECTDISIDNVTEWYLEGGNLHPERPYLHDTHSLLLNWHCSGLFRDRIASPINDTVTIDTIHDIPSTVLPVLQTFFCIEAVHAVTQGFTPIGEKAWRRLHQLCGTILAGEPFIHVKSNVNAPAITAGIPLLTMLPDIMPGQEPQLFRLCADLVGQLSFKPLQPLQPMELEQLLSLARHAYSANVTAEPEMSKRVLRLLEGLFSRELVTVNNWTTDVGVLLQRALHTLNSRHDGLDTVSALAKIPTTQQSSCSALITQATRGRLELLRKSSDIPSPWCLIVTATDNALQWPTPTPESLVMLALELIFTLPCDVQPTAPEASDNCTLTSTEALQELLGTPENTLPFKTLLRTKRTDALVGIMRRAKDVNIAWYDQFIRAWPRSNDGWLAFYGQDIFERVDAAPLIHVHED